MIIYPAIDLKEGRCVRLRQGNIKDYTVYNDNPSDQAVYFENTGCTWLHVVDLDGAFTGKPSNVKAVENIINKVSLCIQLGGGIRTIETIKTWLESGVKRVVLGTAAIENPNLLYQAIDTFPNQIAVAIDARNQKVATNGWVKNTEINAIDLAKSLENKGISAIIYTDINRDGVMQGPNIDSTIALAKSVTTPVIASGGVSSLQDLFSMRDCGIELGGVILGKALYEKTIDLRYAVNVFQQKTNRQC